MANPPTALLAPTCMLLLAAGLGCTRLTTAQDDPDAAMTADSGSEGEGGVAADAGAHAGSDAGTGGSAAGDGGDDAGPPRVDGGDSGASDDSGCTACAPALSGLEISSGTLSPAFDPATTSYTVTVGLGVQTVALTPATAEGVELSVAGDGVQSGEAWSSPVLALGDNVFTVVAGGANGQARSYTVTVTRAFAQRAYIKASNAEEGDRFGVAVSLSADGTALAVGAPDEDSSGEQQDNNAVSNCGAVYVFKRVGSEWLQEAWLKPKIPDPDDGFGNRLALSGDGTTLAVAVPGDDSSATGVVGPSHDNSAMDSGCKRLVHVHGAVR